MAEKWTKTSSPDWRLMNPKPLLALNHLTVPCSFNCVSLFCLSYLVLFPTASRQKKRAASVDLHPLKHSKGFTRATNARTVSHVRGRLSRQFSEQRYSSE